MPSDPRTIPEQIEALARLHGRSRPLVPQSALEWVVWENVAYLVPEEKRALAFHALQKACGGELTRLRTLSRERLLAVASLGGMHAEKRVERLLEIALRVEEDFDGDLEQVRAWPLVKARRALQRFPAIGEPGADKILLHLHAHAVPALESNGLRVLVRLGHVEEAKSYETTYRAARARLEPFAERGCAWLVRAYDLLRCHGQELCKRTEPACDDCPLSEGCPSAW